MSKTSQDPSKYYRAGIAMPLRKKPEFDRRLQALGMKTVGDLVTLFTDAEGIVEALAPVAERLRAEQSQMTDAQRKKLVNQLKGLSAADVAALVAQAAAAA